ncbi:MAG: hypothetical protein ACYC0F_14745 [Rhodanobacter sp.]
MSTVIVDVLAAVAAKTARYTSRAGNVMAVAGKRKNPMAQGGIDA